MKFYKNLYFGDTIKNPGKTRRKLKRHAKLQNVHVIAYMEESGQLAIYHCAMFRRRYYKDHPPYVVGIAGSKEEAQQIICRIAKEAFAATGKVDLLSYLFAENSLDNTVE